MHGNIANVESYLQKGLDPDCKIQSTQTAALHIAASRGYIKMVKLLLHYNANSEIQDANGDTPMILAARRGKNKCVNVLVESGSNVDKVNEKRAYNSKLLHNMP